MATISRWQAPTSAWPSMPRLTPSLLNGSPWHTQRSSFHPAQFPAVSRTAPFLVSNSSILPPALLRRITAFARLLLVTLKVPEQSVFVYGRQWRFGPEPSKDASTAMPWLGVQESFHAKDSALLVSLKFLNT